MSKIEPFFIGFSALCDLETQHKAVTRKMTINSWKLQVKPQFSKLFKINFISFHMTNILKGKYFVSTSKIILLKR